MIILSRFKLIFYYDLIKCKRLISSAKAEIRRDKEQWKAVSKLNIVKGRKVPVVKSKRRNEKPVFFSRSPLPLGGERHLSHMVPSRCFPP